MNTTFKNNMLCHFTNFAGKLFTIESILLIVFVLCLITIILITDGTQVMCINICFSLLLFF